MQRGLSPSAQKAVQFAHHLAIARGNRCVEDAHLFLGALQVEEGEEGTVTTLLKLSGVTREEARLYALSATPNIGKAGGKIPFLASGVQRVLGRARDEARAVNSPLVGHEHIFIACLRNQPGAHIGEVLRPLGLDAAQLRDHLRGLNAKPYSEGNPLNDLTQTSKRAIEAAHAAMRTTYCGRISTAHLLLGLMDGEENVALDTLHAASIDIETLKSEVRASIYNDGEVATPQMKFSPAAKRALERAKKEATACGHSFIGPHHLLHALLPRPASVQEKLAFGNPIDDPLEKVWTQWPVEEIERQYKRLWLEFTSSTDQAAGTKTTRTAPQKPTRSSKVRLNSFARTIGIVCSILGIYYPPLFLLGVTLTSLLLLVGQVRKNDLARDWGANLFFGMVLGGLFVAFVWIISKM